MGISIESWRARIGRFHGGARSIPGHLQPAYDSLLENIALIYSVIVTLLVIGNIELNPGPGDTFMFPCGHCPHSARTTGEHIQHQKLHARNFNFTYVCPLPTCHASFLNFEGVNAHISLHSTKRTEVAGSPGVKCPQCEVLVSTNSELCIHLKDHLKIGEQIFCPLKECERKANFSKLSQFNTHLSLYHPGWKQDTAFIEEPTSVFQEEQEQMDFDDDDGGNFQTVQSDEDDEDICDDSESDAESDVSFNLHGNNSDYDSIIAYFGNFYALLEGKHVVPSSTVDIIAERLSVLSELLQAWQENVLKRTLKSCELSDEAISTVIESLNSMDPFYNSHHKNTLGTCLLTSHLRRTFYKKNFKHIDPIEINLKKNPYDREETIQYVDIRETLSLMLEDPTVQREVDESFEREYPPGCPLGDYPSGSIFRESANPQKRIDLLFFMDAFSCVNPLGSAKKKFKMNGMYFTVGNLRTFLRSYLKSIRLVLIFADSLLKISEKKFRKCFQRVVRDLIDLETRGILYKGETIPVRLQFFLGDNLGQHTLGGFLESFTAQFFCRFCYIMRKVFKSDSKKEIPEFQSGEWRTHESYLEDLEEKMRDHLESCRGVRRNSPFNKLEFFKVCDPRLSPCIAHDLFVQGVVDCDAAVMIKHFVAEDWFSYEDLKRLIRRFKYDATDSRNKPADINDKGVKLGGHAVQNWTLFRLLPFLIEGKIQPTDPFWKLYLLLKSILEYVCAPALSTAQVETMRALILEYMINRKILGSAYKPKHHFFFHYPDLFLKFGALIHHWTLAFEHFHQFFKKVARTCGNFVNLGVTLANRFQLLQAYRSMGHLYPNRPILKKSHPLDPENFEDGLRDFVKHCDFPVDSLEVQCLVLNNISYKKDQWLLLGKDNSNLLVGKIEAIIFDGANSKVVLSRYKASLWTEYGVHCIHVSESIRCVVVLDALENPCPHAVYNFKGSLCVSLKHVFLDAV